MPRKREHPLDYLDFASYKILQAMKDGYKTYTELYKASTLSKRHFDNRLIELIELGLIKEVFVKTERGRSKKMYALTDEGYQVLRRLEEIEQICKSSVAAT